MNTELHAVRIPAALRGFGGKAGADAVFNLQWHGEHITAITPCPAGTPAQGLLLSPLVDLHLHLDKTYTVQDTGAANGDLFRAIDMIAAHRAGWTRESLRPRMQRALQEAWDHGVRAVRTHIDWMTPDRPPAVDVIAELRQAWRERLQIQWVSLTAVDQFDDTEWAHWLARAVKAGGGVLGCFIYRHPGLPRRLRTVFDLAEAYDLELDFHVDEGLHVDATGLRSIAEMTLQRRWQGRVTCGHACSLSVQTADDAQQTLALVAQAGITLTALPTTNLYLQGSWSETPVPRGITRLSEARTAGVRTCLASDNVADPFFPYGCYDPLEAWALGVQAAHLAPAEDWLDSVTVAPAQTMGLAWDGRFNKGCPADFIVLDAHDGLQAMAPAGRRRRICRQGQWIT
ncbi:MAG: amidohydrolase family protein [Hydrogenophaga sp.]|uniref:amidohydrolase family protein n=1 Tax=Hydrogenophaga sp. TaxID=1904254 RepID=UPI001D3EFB29|nr:amidohydrolase family protein [Hydrogenophaga sp.]MBX3608479.1 amidohydrolase family protein [Hydrogenophaga sp.]